MPQPRTISVQEAWNAVENGRGTLVDVREPGEFETVRTPRAENFPLSSLEERAQDLPADRPLFLLCAAGSRAAHRWTIAAAAKSPLTFVAVANRSGIASTAISNATPAAGMPTLASTGASNRNAPLGTPGVAKLSATAAATTVK